MQIIDAQIHCWRNLPSVRRHWFSSYHGPDRRRFLVSSALEAMEAVGVDAAVIDVIAANADGSRRYDDVYGPRAAESCSSKLACVTRIDHRAPDVDERVALARQLGGAVALRISFTGRAANETRSGESHDRLLSAAQEQGLPVMMNVTGQMAIAERAARAYPRLLVIVDHLGMPQPPMHQLDTPPLRRMTELLELASIPNIAVKFSGGPAYSSEGYPFTDVWPELRKVVAAFGAERLMWGSDFTRFWGKYTYAELLGFVLHASALSTREKELILGGSLRGLLGWPVSPTP